MELNLHRIGKVADWELVSPAEQNPFQKVAAATRGILTPANLITVIGALVTLWGAAELFARDWWLAIVLLLAGRVLDVADGFIAHRTGTKSALGETLDATADKIVTVLTVVALFLAHVAPTWLMSLFVLPHIIITIIVLVDRIRGVKLHPSRLGKTTMLLAWLVIPLLLIVKAAELNSTHPFAVLVMLFVLTSAAFGFITANSYLSQSGIQPEPNRNHD